MWIFRKKQELQEKIENILSGILQEQQSAVKKTAVLEEKLLQINTEVKRHNMSLEDLLDNLQEREEQETIWEQRIAQLEAEEEKLVSLVLCRLEQFYTLRRASETMDSQWQRQLEIFEEEANRFMAAANLREIRGEGEKVDYECHEVIQAIDTEDEQLAMTVAEVYCPGCSMDGNVIRKARVAAYRYEKR